MNRRKKSAHSPRISSPPIPKRRRIALDSSSPVRRKSSGDTVRPPPEYPIFNYKQRCPTLMRLSEAGIDEEDVIDEDELITLQHELESILANGVMEKRRSKGELQFLINGDYPKVDLRKRLMPKYETRSIVPPTSPTAILEKEGICGLPEEDEEDDLNTNALHMPTRFWSWCKEDFLKNVDADYLRRFKETIVDKYSNEEMRKYFINEPWKYRIRTASKRSNRTSSNGSSMKTPKRVSISNDVECSNGKSSGRKSSSARIPSRRNSEKEAMNNNKIMPMIGNMVISACREMKEPKLEITPKRRSRGISRDESKERRASISIKTEEIAVEVEEEEMEHTMNGNGYENGHRISPRLHSPRHVKKEKEEENERIGNSNGCNGYLNGDYRVNGYSNGFVNGISNGKMNGDHSPKRKNGEVKNGLILNGSVKRKSSSSAIIAPTLIEKKEEYEDVEMCSYIEDFDAKVIGSKIVSKLIAGGILPESSAQIFEQMSREEDGGSAGTSKIQISEEGRDEAEDPTMDDLSEELKRCQLELQEVQPQLNALMTLAWRRAKAQYAFYYSFDQMRAADYDLFKLGVNNFREYPRRLPSIIEQPLLKSALIRRNKQARLHYGNTYRRHPKYRWRLKPSLTPHSRKRASNTP